MHRGKYLLQNCKTNCPLSDISIQFITVSYKAKEVITILNLLYPIYLFTQVLYLINDAILTTHIVDGGQKKSLVLC